ncbi:MAG: PAS domain-containing protein [Rhizonema sp. PD38]|nr:PAS domain-containing protein [Rhizonema sp. PD38]
MHALAQRLSLPSLYSVIDFSLANVASYTSLLDVIALMSQCQSQASYVSIIELNQHQILPTGVEASVQALKCFTEQDLRILSSGIDFKTAKMSEVKNILVIGLKQSEIHHISSALSILRQYNLLSMSVVYEAGKLTIYTTDESIYQVIEQEVGENAQTEERLRLLELVVNHANDAILIAEADALDEPLGSQIVYVNKAFILMIGRLVSEFVCETWGILHEEKTSHSQLERIRAALQNGLSISISN